MRATTRCGGTSAGTTTLRVVARSISVGRSGRHHLWRHHGFFKHVSGHIDYNLLIHDIYIYINYIHIYIYILYFSVQSTGRWSYDRVVLDVEGKCLHRNMRRPDLIELSTLYTFKTILYQVKFNMLYTCSWSRTCTRRLSRTCARRRKRRPSVRCL